MSPLFETARTVVRRLGPADAPRLEALDSDPEVMRYINGGRPTPIAVIKKKLGDWTSGYDAPQPHGFWAIDLKPGLEFAGWVHLRPDRLQPEFDELGYRLTRASWGRGLATEVARAMVEHTMQTWKRKPIVAGALIGNVASQRVMEKIGMYREYEFHYPEDILPGWSEAERAAVRYRIDTLS
jgi:RimJ/RimL family protein N-acetyltransferase